MLPGMNKTVQTVGKTFGKVLGLCADMTAIVGLLLGAQQKGLCFWIILFVLIIVLVYLISGICSYVSFGELLMQVARRGHLHTLRMILLAEEYRQKEGKPLIKGKSATFSFHVEPRDTSGKSTIKYEHTFCVKRKTSHKVNCRSWIFGDENIPPTNCRIQVDEHRPEQGDLTSVGVQSTECADHNGIYQLQWEIPGGVRNENIDLKIYYERRKAFGWDRNELFVIYPKSLIEGIKIADFKVYIAAEDIDKVARIGLLRLPISGNQDSSKESHFVSTQSLQDMPYYLLKDVSISKDNVYLITVYRTNNEEKNDSKN